jgi:uncharacterized BrkB/YihY/UPF0761 family membrane protein
MKPNLTNKKIINNFLINTTKEVEINKIDKNTIFFNFFIILLFIIFILFLIYRYLEKRKENNNVK